MRAVPQPPGPLGDFNARCDPGQQAIPGDIIGLRRPIRQDQSWILIACLPQGQQGTLQVPPRGCKAVPPCPRLGDERLQRLKGHRQDWPKGTPRIDAHKRVPAQLDEPPQPPRGLHAPIRQHADGPVPWDGGPQLPQPPQPCAPPGVFGIGGQHDPSGRHGTAARDHTLTANTTNRSPNAIASMAKASWVPCHQLTTQPNQGAKHVSTRRAWRLEPRLCLTSSYHSRRCWRTVCSSRCIPAASRRLTAVSAQDLARTSPRLYSATTQCWGLLI